MEQRMDFLPQLPMAPHQPTTDVPEDSFISNFLWGPLAARALPMSTPILARDRTPRAEQPRGSQVGCDEVPGSTMCDAEPGSMMCDAEPGSTMCDAEPGSTMCDAEPGSTMMNCDDKAPKPE
jgi:hypothetical protein